MHTLILLSVRQGVVFLEIFDIVPFHSTTAIICFIATFQMLAQIAVNDGPPPYFRRNHQGLISP